MIVVLVEAEAGGTGGVAETSLEAVRFARDLAAAGDGVPLHAVLVGEPSGGHGADVVAELGKHGVAHLHVAVGEVGEGYAAAAWGACLAEVRERTGAVVVTAAGTPRGNEVLAHVAARTGVPMAANVLSFEGLSPFVVTRQVVGGTVREEMRLAQRPAVFSVAGHAVEPEPAAEAVEPEVQRFEPALAPADLVARVVSSEPGGADASDDLKSARVVVGAGRGAGGPDGFDGVLELAELLHGRLGVSRVVTSMGWRPHHEQVGQTGSRISPELYVACGISGAIQHWAGCASSRTILAINTDPEAPMVTRADYAVIGDMHEVVPAVNEELRRRR